MYFQKKLPETKTCTSDSIKVNYKLTKYDTNQEVTESLINEYKKINYNQEFIFLKGFIIKEFEGHPEEDKEINIYKENLDNVNGEKLPIIAVSYTIKEYQINKEEEKQPSEDSDDEDDDEQDKFGKNEQSYKAEESVQQKEISTQEKLNQEKGNEVQIDKNAKIVKKVRIIEKTKVKYYKKYCRLEIPFLEEYISTIYNINEPLGYLDIKFECDKYRQEEYFINKNIKITIDK